MQPLGCKHMGADQLDERRESRAAGSDPIRQRGDVEVDPLVGERLALPVQGQMLAEFRLEDGRQQFGSGASARDRMERRRDLGDRVIVSQARQTRRSRTVCTTFQERGRRAGQGCTGFRPIAVG